MITEYPLYSLEYLDPFSANHSQALQIKQQNMQLKSSTTANQNHLQTERLMINTKN